MFLAQVYLSTRWDELTVTAWPDEQRRAFLLQQFGFQSRDWERNYPRMERLIVRIDGEDAGRLYIDRRAAERDLRVVDIALLPTHRGRGVASRIFARLFAEADSLGWKTSIHVEQHNRAKNLYARLGFGPVRTHGIYLLLERPPQPTAAPASLP